MKHVNLLAINLENYYYLFVVEYLQRPVMALYSKSNFVYSHNLLIYMTA